MTAYYNEHDPFAAAWLRELIADGLIAPGEVDERSIEDVVPTDLAGFVQCHWFAGIGIWSLALRQAGWPDDEPLWTGSCPCQPFSAAGKGGGFDDERHLWPAFHWLIEQCSPELVLGEQVASKDGLAWLDLVSADVEASGYAFGAVDTCAAGFGAPHIRQRLYWMADASRELDHGTGNAGARGRSEYPDRGTACSLADADDTRLEGRLAVPECADERAARPRGMGGGLGHAGREPDERRRGTGDLERPSDQEQGEAQQWQWSGDADCGSGSDGRVAYALRGGAGHAPGEGLGTQAAFDGQDGCLPGQGLRTGFDGADNRPGPLNGLWRDADWLCCTDGKWRPVAPGTFPLAPAGTVHNRVGTLRGAGNAINLAQAQGFIEAVMDIRSLKTRKAA